jgi:hypothetical protein
MTQGKIAHMSESGPRAHTGTPHMHAGRKVKKIAFGDSPYA